MKAEAKPNLYLVGFMGTGKSTIGRLVAQRVGLEFIDSDIAIESEQRRSIPEIFAKDGEAAFRAMERAFIESGHAASGCLVACGGGLAVQPGMMDLLKRRGLVFALVASPKGIFERVKGNPHRPLLQVADPLAEIERLLAIRQPYYDRANAQILTEGRSVNEVVGHVCRSYKHEAASWGR